MPLIRGQLPQEVGPALVLAGGERGSGAAVVLLVPLLLVVCLALAACTAVTGAADPVPGDPVPGDPTSGDAVPGGPGRQGCRGVTYDEVRGPRPGYGPRTLGSFSGERAVCAAHWLPEADQRFVPQGAGAAPG